jgi:ethanolamine ammonia-lyase small subunit
MLSAYLTYGRELSGQLRWSAGMDHSLTTAVCGINKHGKPPLTAAGKIAKYVERIFEQGRSGVELTSLEG